jgi:hypothetical protein
MKLDLSDEETAALLKELDHIIDGDRYFLSPGIQTFNAIVPSSDRSQCASHYRRRSNTRRRELPQPDGAPAGR